MNERTVRIRLAAMMGLVYAVQGAFWPLLAVHLQELGLGGRSRGWIFSTLAIGSTIVPLGAGQLVDRLMPAERFLTLAFALGTALLALLATGLVTQATSLFLLFLVYWMIVAPSYGLTNALAMRNLKDPERQFSGVRLWGTIGWMAAGWLVSMVMVWSGRHVPGTGTQEAFVVATALSFCVVVYSLTLPHTPPLAGRTWSGVKLA